MTQKQYNEIDLFELLKILWKDKLKLGLIVFLCLISVYIYRQINPNTTFIATTTIKPISSHEFDKYKQFNAIQFYEIDRRILLDLYIEYIKEGTILENAIDKFNLIKKENFIEEEDYKQAAEIFASQMIELKQQQINGQTTDSVDKFYTLTARYDDIEKWKNMLSYIDKEASNRVKEIIINRFNVLISVAKQKRDFLIEDLNMNIKNLTKDYERSINDRLVFLAEQATIARKLGLKKNSFSTQLIEKSNSNSSFQNKLLDNFTLDPLLYMKGYETIEHEIDIIKSLKNKTSFIEGLLNLEQKKRYILQDQDLARAENLFNKTPVRQNGFHAAILKVTSTKFKKEDKTLLYYPISLILGCIIGVIYVFTFNIFKNSKYYKKLI